MKTKSIVLISIVACAVAHAQTPPAGGASGPNSGSNLDQTPLFNAIDANKDGKLSKEEWTKAGAPDMIFSILDSNSDGIVTMDEMKANPPPADIDTNKDGKVTLDELKAFAASMGSGGGGAPPSGSPPAGAPPAAK